MRYDEKQVDGPELERLPQLERKNELQKEREDELPILDRSRRLDGASEALMVATMRAIFERRTVVVNDIQLPQRELRALEALQAAVTGRDEKLSQFVYARDRRHLLERALAVLQPGLIQEAAPPLQDLVDHVGHLRVDLKELDDAQDELIAPHAQDFEQGAEGDSDDKPDDESDSDPNDDEEADADADDDLDDRRKRAPAAKRKPKSKKPVSSLDGPEAPALAKPTSTLSDGPPFTERDSPATSLGDPDEIARIAQSAMTAQTPPPPQAPQPKPWWKLSRGK